MPTTYVSISSTTLGSTQASVSFSSIPSTYTDLLVALNIRTDRSFAFNDTLRVTFNSVTSTVYSATRLQGTGNAGASQARNNNQTFIFPFSTIPGNTATANTFGSAELYIPNYTSSVDKNISFFSALERSDLNANMEFTASLWRNSSAISSIGFTSDSGSNFVAGSTFYLYGIKNS